MTDDVRANQCSFHVARCCATNTQPQNDVAGRAVRHAFTALALAYSIFHFEFLHTAALTPRKEPVVTMNVPSQEVVLPVPVISVNKIFPSDGVAVKVVPETQHSRHARTPYFQS